MNLRRRLHYLRRKNRADLTRRLTLAIEAGVIDQGEAVDTWDRETGWGRPFHWRDHPLFLPHAPFLSASLAALADGRSKTWKTLRRESGL